MQSCTVATLRRENAGIASSFANFEEVHDVVETWGGDDGK